MHDPFSTIERYHRQMLLPGIGEAGQHRLRAARALVVGCGALGSIIVDTLARAGIGSLTIVDRDLVEITNLQRQILFDEQDVEQGLPKAEAARRKVQCINRAVTVHAHVDDFNHRNAERYAEDADIILDGLDNFETRYLLNDLAVRNGLPYIYGGAVGTNGVATVILPHPAQRAGKGGAVQWAADDATACLRCLFPEAPPPGVSPTCDTAGVLAPIVMMIAAHQCAEAIKLLTGNLQSLERGMISIDVWMNERRRFDMSGARQASCRCCSQGQFDFLLGRGGSATTALCGRNAVQVTPSGNSSSTLDLEEAARRLAPHGAFEHNAYLLRGNLRSEAGNAGPIELTLFATGRAIIKGTTEPEVARSIYAKYVGS